MTITTETGAGLPDAESYANPLHRFVTAIQVRPGD